MKNYLILLVVILFVSCSSDVEPELSSEKDIISFEIEGLETEIIGNKIKIFVNASENYFHFTPQIVVSEKARIYPSSNMYLDFSTPRTFTVTAENNSTKIYTTEVVVKEGLKEVNLHLVSSTYDDSRFFGSVIDNVEKKVTIYYEHFFFEMGRIPIIEIIVNGDNYTTIPEDGATINLDLNEISITSENTTEVYQVVFKNTEKSIKSVRLPIASNLPFALHVNYPDDSYFPQNEVSGLGNGDFIFYTLTSQNLDNLTPQIYISYGATMTPSSSVPQNFENDITYEVTSESNKTASRIVRVIKKPILFYGEQIQTTVFSIGNTTTYFHTKYWSVSKISEVSLVNVDTNEIIPCQITNNDFIANEETSLYLTLNSQPEPNSVFYLRVTLEDGAVIDKKRARYKFT